MSRPDQTPTAPRWTIVLPVQRASRAKSRLRLPPGVDRPTLARAIALDSLAAVRATASVGRLVVVTADDDVARECEAAGDQVVRDDGRSLTAAIRTGLDAALTLSPASPTAVLLPDLPALTSADLTAALEAASAHAFAVVPDAEGTGSVLLTAARDELLRPAFGPASAHRHRDLGAVVLDLDLPRLRRDVDTASALLQASALGLGPATRAALGATVHDLEDVARAGACAH